MAVNAYGGAPKHGALSGLGNDDHPQYSKTEHGHADYLPLTGKAADSELLDGIDSTGFLRTAGKAADSDLLDGIDSTGFLRKPQSGLTSVPSRENTLQLGTTSVATNTLNQFLRSGWYDGTNMIGAPDADWWLVEVIAHSGGAHWQRQIAHSMTGNRDTQITLSRRCNGGDPALAASWSPWRALGSDSLHYVGTAGEPAFLNGWSNWGDIWMRVAFWREGETIHLQGLARAGTQQSTIFTLPPGYRPAEGSHHATLSALGLGDVHVFNDGRVNHRDALGNDPNWLSLDTVSFRRA